MPNVTIAKVVDLDRREVQQMTAHLPLWHASLVIEDHGPETTLFADIRISSADPLSRERVKVAGMASLLRVKTGLSRIRGSAPNFRIGYKLLAACSHV